MFVKIVSINGRIVSGDEAKISVFDNSLLYAEGLFETLLGIDDHAVFQKEHLDRLFRGAKVIGLKVPVTRQKLEDWMHEILSAHPGHVKQLRLTITSGESARWAGHQGPPQIIMIAGPHTMPLGPYKLMISPFRVDQESVFRRIKTISYAIQAAAFKQARQKQYDDALMLNEKGQVAEASSANIFWAKRGVIYTPPIDAGCLEGTTRLVVFREAAKLGLDVKEKPCPLTDVLKADEIFVSSATKLVAPVGEIADKSRTRFETGPITLNLRDHFYRMVGLEPPKR